MTFGAFPPEWRMRARILSGNESSAALNSLILKNFQTELLATRTHRAPSSELHVRWFGFPLMAFGATPLQLRMRIDIRRRKAFTAALFGDFPHLLNTQSSRFALHPPRA
jgi:hypothetical protein